MPRLVAVSRSTISTDQAVGSRLFVVEVENSGIALAVVDDQRSGGDVADRSAGVQVGTHRTGCGTLGNQAVRRQVDLAQTVETVDDDRRIGAVAVFVAEQAVARRVHQIAVAVLGEGTGTGEVFLAVGAFDDEETTAVKRQVGGGGRIDLGAFGRNAVADLGFDAAGIVRAIGRRQDHRGKFRRCALVAGGVGVGDVFSHCAQTVCLSIHARAACSHHSVKTHVGSSFSSLSQD